MVLSIPVRCRCGRVHGEALDVSPKTTTRVLCYCVDCRAFARWLGGDDLLDAHGGSDLVQLPPSRLRIHGGLDEVRCLRLSDKGMHRWYARCCRTPLGNTLGPGVPFVGVPRLVLRDTDDATLGRATGIQGRQGFPSRPPGVHAKAPVGFLLRVGWRLLGWWLGRKSRPSPFFIDDHPRVVPEVLTVAERAALNDPA